ncbi:MAG: prepilin peptidase [Candidatus Neomarinimicrobiota bacterium]
MLQVLKYCFFFYAGAIIGSFLNVLIYRLPRGLSIVQPPSHCPHCTNPIKPYDNFPILSFLFLRGRCRHCGQRISGRYILVEILTGLSAILLIMMYGPGFEALLYSILFIILTVIVFIDIDFQKIPNTMIIGGIIPGGLIVLLLIPQRLPDALLGLSVGGGIMLFWAIVGRWFFKKECLGAGDIKLAILVGLFLGTRGIILALFTSYVLAGLIGGGLVVFKGLRLDGRLPYAPFLAVGTVITLIAGQPIVNWYLGLF